MAMNNTLGLCLALTFACDFVAQNNRMDRVMIVIRFIGALFLQQFVHEELDLRLVFGFGVGVFEMGFELEGIGLLLEGDAEVDVDTCSFKVSPGT